jgi:O-antigen ligase
MKPMSHAHNLPLQVWAESGSLGFVMVLVGALLLARRVFNHQLKPQAMAISVPLIYSLLFNLFELGMFKVPLLMVLFGTMLSGALIKPTSGAGKRLPADGIAIAKAVVQ